MQLVYPLQHYGQGSGCLHGLGRHIVCPINDANARQAKVCQLDMPLARDEQVIRLEITVDDSLQEHEQS